MAVIYPQTSARPSTFKQEGIIQKRFPWCLMALSWLVWGWTIRKGGLFHTAIDITTFPQNQNRVRSGILWSGGDVFTCNLLGKCCLSEQKLQRFRCTKNCTTSKMNQKWSHTKGRCSRGHKRDMIPRVTSWWPTTRILAQGHPPGQANHSPLFHISSQVRAHRLPHQLEFHRIVSSS
jgi:hypothetical protein